MTTAYLFNADIYCEDCAADIGRCILAENGNKLPDLADSEEFPCGPYSDGGGEADCPQHCGKCGVFLENPLTGDGYAYVADAIASWPNAGSQEFLKQWADFYGGDDDALDAVIAESTLV